MSLIKPLDERTRRDWSLRLDGETVPPSTRTARSSRPTRPQQAVQLADMFTVAAVSRLLAALVQRGEVTLSR